MTALRSWSSALLLSTLVLVADAAWAELPVLSNGPAWIELDPQQRQSLQPLQKDWVNFDTASKRKWIELAARVPSMSPEERDRVQQRMREWAELSVAQRRQARIAFQDTRKLGAGDELPTRWQQYQELSAEQREALARRADQRKSLAASARKRAAADTGTERTAIAPLKVPAPLLMAVPPQRPGVTTTLGPAQAAVPLHQLPGMPRLVASPDFVDPVTLLPRRGPQGAGMIDRTTRLADR